MKPPRTVSIIARENADTLSSEKVLPTAMLAHGTGTSSTQLARVFTDDADHEIIQRRLGLFYTVLGAMILTLYVFGAVTLTILAPEQFWTVHASLGKVIHIVGGALVLGVGLVCMKSPRLFPRPLLSIADLVGIAKVMALSAAIVVFTPLEIHREFLMLPIIVNVAAMRAAIVPSPPRWTAIAAATGTAPAIWVAYVASREVTRWRGTVVPLTICWCVLAVAGAFIISKVVYGLRTEVKKAKRLGQYTLEDKIGEGGMGMVYRARHALLRRPTAIKLLLPDRSASHDILRFEREVQMTSLLTHPNTVAIYDFGHTEDGVFYYAMEYLDGLSLHELVTRHGPQPAARVAGIVAQIASALAEAHTMGLVHRDIKPANIFLCERGGLPDFVKVLDFGLVKELGQFDPQLSRVNAILGTPHYMAPESITDPGTVDARVDIYALGAVAYFLVTGTTVFDGNNLVEICSHHLHSEVEAPSKRLRKTIPSKLDEIIVRCLAKSPEDRPETSAALATSLRELVDEHDAEWGLEDALTFWRRQRGSASRQPNKPAAKAVAQRPSARPAEREMS